MIEAIRITLPYLALFSHFLFVVLFATVVFRHSFGRSTVSLIGKRALVLGFLISLAALAGSLFYSEIVGYEACVLCWWQRVFLYPQLVLFAIALWKNEIRLCLLCRSVGVCRSDSGLPVVCLYGRRVSAALHRGGRRLFENLCQRIRLHYHSHDVAYSSALLSSTRLDKQNL